MSHIAEIKADFDDPECIEQAALRLGWVVEHKDTYTWFGRWVGDSPLPPGVKLEDLGKCEFAIHVPGERYEIGVVRGADGRYSLIYDYWCNNLTKALGGREGNRLRQAYGVAKLRKQAKRLGHKVVREVVRSDGKISVVLQ
jgi:hypothetical protein